MLSAYYEARGWDGETGKPLRQKLIELGLRDVADDLWG
jgi:aldehyde:ferredoxin oxidoreductase